MPKQGQQKGTPARRAEFIEYLRSIGPGHFCVYWPWSANRSGYTHIHVDGQKVAAHRWVYEQFHGPLPPRQGVRGAVGDDLVLHKCDNRTCVRPDHLFLGSQQDNIDDMYAKGRSGRRPALSLDECRRITELRASGTSAVALAAAFGVSKATISNMLAGRSTYSRRR